MNKFKLFQNRFDKIEREIEEWCNYRNIKIVSSNQTESFDGDGKAWLTISIFYEEQGL